MSGPSQHLTWNELACVNRLTVPVVDGGRRFQPGEIIAPYPQEWRESRAINLAATFEDLRALLGGVPIAINSAYRTHTYNQRVQGEPGSQHPLGRALDIRHPVLTPHELHATILELHRDGRLPLLGGLGRYPTFTHIDVRPIPFASRHLAQWG